MKKFIINIFIGFCFLTIIVELLYIIFSSPEESSLFKISKGDLLGIWGLLATVIIGIYQIYLAYTSNKLYLKQQNSLYQQVNGVFSTYGLIYNKLQKAITSISQGSNNITELNSDIQSALGSLESIINSSSIVLNQIKHSIMNNKIEIISAEYRQIENKDKSKILTGIIKSKIENMKYSFPVTPNELGGDPYPKIKKELVIKYNYNNKEYETSFEDYYMASLP